MTLDHRSLSKLEGVHPDLLHVVMAASEQAKFRVTEGLRTRDRQAELYRSGKSKTMNSRHLTGHAVDFVAIGDDGIATFDMPEMTRVAQAMREAAQEQGISIEWGAAAKYGGDFKTFNDSPHIQLPWSEYPAIGVPVVTRAVEVAGKPPVAVGTGAALGVTAAPSLPSLPAPPDVSGITGWTAFGEALSGAVSWMGANPIITTICAAWIGLAWFWPRIAERMGWQQSSPSS